MAKRCPCCTAGGPARYDGSIVQDPLYMLGGLCFDCWLDSLIPRGFEKKEGYRWDAACQLLRATKRPTICRPGSGLPIELLHPGPAPFTRADEARLPRPVAWGRRKKHPVNVDIIGHADQLEPAQVRAVW